MDNLEDSKKSDSNSKKVTRKRAPASKSQANGITDKLNGGVQPADNMLATAKPTVLTDMPFMANQFMGTPGTLQAAPSIGHIVKSMLRFKWTFIIVFILVSIPAVLFIWTQIVPKYRAKGEVHVRPIIPRLVFNTEDNGMIPLYNSYVNTQVSYIRGTEVLQRALDQKEVQATQWYNNPSKALMRKIRGNQTPPLERLRDELSALPRRGTEIIDVSFTAEKSEDARVIVDTVLEQYLKYTRELKNDSQDELYQQLEQQYRTLEVEISGREKTLANLQKLLGTGNPQQVVSSKKIRLEQTQADLNKIRQDIALLDRQVKQTQTTSQDSNDGAVAAVGTVEPKKPEYYEDPEWHRLDNEVRTLQHQIDNSPLNSNQPESIRAEKDLAFTKESLERREKQLDEQWNNKLNELLGVSIDGSDGSGVIDKTKSVELQLEQAKLNEQLLLTDLESQRKDFNDFFDRTQNYEREMSELESRRGLFETVRQRRDQKAMERNVEVGTVEVLMGAFVSSRPYNDRRVVFTAMAICMALGMAGGIVYLRSIKNQAIFTSREIPQPVQVPILGNLPVTKLKGILDDEVSSLMTESIRVVRTALLSRLNGQGFTTLLVTSATPGTGKSTFTMLLGKSLAQAGKKVLVIDADLKKMALTEQFIELPDNPGFVRALRDPSKYKQNIFQAYNMDLDFMPAGKSDEDDTVPEEIANGAFKTLIDKLRSRYNFVLLDGSPILPVADSIILSGQVDGTIFVERENISNRTNIINALERVRSADGQLLGTVFIGSESSMHYGYDYDYSKTS
jgi:succinoglycan biosynthesis transport protein ExoP